MQEIWLIPLLLFIVAFFYSSVGHGGASGYLAILSLLGITVGEIKSSALILNVFVAGVAFYQYYKAGHFRWRLFYPFIILSIPMAYLGSFVELNPTVYKQVLGFCLLLAVARIIGFFKESDDGKQKEVPIITGVLIGAVLGFVSGVIGIGGGIILSPLIILFSWGNLKQTSAASALFIVVNSLAGIVGLLKQGFHFNSQLSLWIIISLVGGFLGAYWGSRKAEGKMLKNLLASVLLFAAIKLIFV